MTVKSPLVTIKMESGATIKLALDPESAPNTVNNFVSLVEDGFYNGLSFHRVIPGFMIQGGCPQGTGTGNPGYSIQGEFSGNNHPNSLRHKRGVISMARSGHPDSAGCQFFIMVADAPHLDGQYAAFGQVVEGMKAVDTMVAAERDGNDKPRAEQKMQEVTVDTYGEPMEKPETKER